MKTLILNPIAFTLGSIEVHWYGIILGTAALVGLLLAVQEGKRFGIKPDFFMDLLLLGVPSAIIGARIYYVAFMWEDYKGRFLDVFKIWEGGIAIYGALIGAFICGFFYFRYKGYNFWRMVDICAPSLLAGQMIGRWGNFMNQEAYGGETTEAFLRDTLHLPNFIVEQMLINGAYRHPAFLYESLWSLVGLVILFILRRQRFLRAGELVASYVIWYSLGRFFIEALRTDSLAFIGPSWLASFINALWTPMELVFMQGYLDPSYGNIRISQALALLLIIGAIVLIIVRRRTGHASAHYNDPIVTSKPERNVDNNGKKAGAGEAADSASKKAKESEAGPDRGNK
ncbi:prolipoprotein diacylglyceryl transferase [Paenibacillus arenilitoris]|uniref:Phosphatidylglycerol--prolipoprotein diacylglyceryl transferase n=1 Tax=Paenibacillus arenilitoris TaxID=2772299 RepID=A0A927CRW4_9BACL|nr:prolipoprotein diacylglyceryl transferase [Paenibacillus arenilitoris]MBD2872619.1 prolipoprotein diacylglyceryl transferase [Paenibacillus arenilitoris]